MSPRLAAALGGLALPVLRRLDAETAHGLTVRALEALPPGGPDPVDRRLALDVFGLRFPHPVGLAAGFDKHAEVPGPLLSLGFGFVEIGTVTPLPQPGNPRPRLFRLAEDEAVVNRFGFNSEGHDAVVRRLRASRPPGIVGVNIGANKDSADRAADYVRGIAAFAGLASYFTINVSSPNTPGLRDLQHEAALDDLLARCVDQRDAAAPGTPVLVKIAPDLALADLDSVVAVARRRKVDGLVVSNTTVSRPASLKGAARGEAGGLSGRPLFPLSTRMLAQTFLRVEGAFPLVGVGGIDSAQAAFAKIEAGATLVQLYTALVFKGPGLVRVVTDGLGRRLASDGLAGLAAAVGRRAAEIAARPDAG